MRYLFDKFRVHHTRNDIYESRGVSHLPIPFRLTLKDTLSMRRGLNLRRTAPKPIQPWTYTPPKNSHVTKEELLKNFPSNCLPGGVLPVNSSLIMNSFLLTDLQKSLTAPPVQSSTDTDEILALDFRFFPEQIPFIKNEFTISKEVNQMLMHVFTSLGLEKMVRTAPEMLLNTRYRGGIHHVLEETGACTSTSTPFQKVMEFVTYYKGMHGRLIILVSFGIGCTVWYTFNQDFNHLETLFSEKIPYQSFMNVNFKKLPLHKMSYVEYKYITDQVLSAYENVYPFTEINLPSIYPDSLNSDVSNPDDGSNARVALGVGIIVAVFLAMGLMSYSPPELELILTSQTQELIATTTR